MQREWTPDDYIAMLRRRWLLITVLGILGSLLGYGGSRLLTNRYTSQAVVLIEQPTVPTEFVRPVISADVSERVITIQQQILSRARLEPLIDKFGLFPLEQKQVPTETLVAKLRSGISVKAMKPLTESDNARLPGFTITFTWDDPKAAQLVCSAVSSMFIEENLQLRQENSEQTTRFLNHQLAEAKAKLDEHDNKLAAFKSRFLGYLPDEVQTNLNILAGLKSELDATTQAIARAQQDKTTAESNLAQQLASWRASQTGHNADTYEEQLAALQTQLASLQAKYTDGHPDVIKAKMQIEALKKKISESEEQSSAAASQNSEPSSAELSLFRQLRLQITAYDETITSKTKQQDRIQQEIKLYQDRVQSTPAIEQQYQELNRDHQTALELYNELLKKQAQSAMAADLERRQEAEQFHILDPANLPGSPSYPNRPLFGLGGLGAGLALGAGLGLLLEKGDTSLRSEKDVEALLQLPVLAMVPPLKISPHTSSLLS